MELEELAQKLFNPASSYVPKIEDTQKRIRGRVNGMFIFDTTKAKLVWEHKWFPHYWVPASSIQPSDRGDSSEIPNSSGSTVMWLRVPNAVTTTETTLPFLTTEKGPLAQYVKFNFKDLDEWLEEQSPICFHPRDPYHRVDVLPTSRHIRIEIAGTKLADTKDEGGVMGLWETSFPGRWYLPTSAVHFEYLGHSSTETGCPYKGTASYYDAHLPGYKIIKDVAWYYKFPLPESAKIQDMLCFYPEKVDMWIDGEKV